MTHHQLLSEKPYIRRSWPAIAEGEQEELLILQLNLKPCCLTSYITVRGIRLNKLHANYMLLILLLPVKTLNLAYLAFDLLVIVNNNIALIY